MKDLTSKIWTGVRWALALIAVIGASSAGFQLWLLDKVVDNGERIGDVKTEIVERINVTEKNLLDELNNISKSVSVIETALGGSPERIQHAALQVEQTASAISSLKTSAEQVNAFAAELDTMKEDVSKIKLDIEDIKKRLYSAPK